MTTRKKSTAIVAANTLTQQQLGLQEVGPLAKNASAYLETVRAFEITDEESVAQFADMRRQIDLASKKLEAKKKSVSGPLADAVRALNALFKPAADDLEECMKISKQKLDAYARNVVTIAEEQRRAEEQRARAAVGAAHAVAANLRLGGAESTAKVIEQQAADAVAAAAQPAKIEVVRGVASSFVITKTWKARVRDLKALCLAVGQGRLPVYVVEPKQSALDGLARTAEKAQLADGVEFYQDVGSQTKG